MTIRNRLARLGKAVGRLTRPAAHDWAARLDDATLEAPIEMGRAARAEGGTGPAARRFDRAWEALGLPHGPDPTLAHLSDEDIAREIDELVAADAARRQRAEATRPSGGPPCP